MADFEPGGWPRIDKEILFGPADASGNASIRRVGRARHVADAGWTDASITGDPWLFERHGIIRLGGKGGCPPGHRMKSENPVNGLFVNLCSPFGSRLWWSRPISRISGKIMEIV